jgi:hypothetical protein
VAEASLDALKMKPLSPFILSSQVLM